MTVGAFTDRDGKLSFGAIVLLWKWDKESIEKLTRAVSRTGRHPGTWKGASCVLFRKPGKADYTELRAYCSISLLTWVQ